MEKQESWYRNYYVCNSCDEHWTDEWSSTCNDKCPKCGKEIEPCDYEELEPEKDIIGYKPADNEYPIAGLMENEIYKNISMGQKCHPGVKNWVNIYEDDININDFIIIPYDGK